MKKTNVKTLRILIDISEETAKKISIQGARHLKTRKYMIEEILEEHAKTIKP